METQWKRFYFVIILMLAVVCVTQVQAGNEKAGKQIRQIPNFHGISIGSGIDLYLTQGTSEKVVVEADTDIIDDIITEVKDGVLHIYMKKKLNWSWNEDRTVRVTFDDLTHLDVSSGADVESENSFKLDELKISVSSGADLEIEDITAETIWLDASSGSDAEVTGCVISFDASSSSGADLSCGDLVAENCVVKASSGADAVVHAKKSIKASASSGGDIRYKGNPVHKDIIESSGGDVRWD